MKFPSDDKERILEYASYQYRQFHTQCFWLHPKDLVITKDMVPFVITKLRQYGGNRGRVQAGKLKLAYDLL